MIKQNVLDQDLNYGEILAGQPGACEKNMFIGMQSQNFKKKPHIEIQTNSQNVFLFYDSFNGF